jgi:hypothetical protein
MDFRVEADLPAPVSVVHDRLADLSGYPAWAGIVRGATREPGPEPAWSVEVGARVGLIRLTKRVRMVRAVDETARLEFERAELDGAEHSSWVLTVELREKAGPNPVTFAKVAFSYAGIGWVPGLDAVLAIEARRSARRLRGLLV